MKKSPLVLVALLLASPVFADEVKSEQLLTLAAADTKATAPAVAQAVKQDEFAADTEQEAKFYGRLLSAKFEAELPEQIAKEAASNIQF